MHILLHILIHFSDKYFLKNIQAVLDAPFQTNICLEISRAAIDAPFQVGSDDYHHGAVFDALFRWGLMTITTVGYDLNPSTLLGQWLWLWKTISTSINKVCMNAIFVNILSPGYPASPL